MRGDHGVVARDFHCPDAVEDALPRRPQLHLADQGEKKLIFAVGPEIMACVTEGNVKKGDVLGVARVAGIMGVKKTSELIPMCHPLPIQKCAIDYELDQEKNRIHVLCTVKTEGKTGVEMEALTGVQVTLLTIYDMCKAIDKHMVMSEIHLIEKTGGKSGDFRFEEEQ